MVKVPVYSTTGGKVSEIELPKQFSEPVRADLIKRAALAVQSKQHQAYASDPEAGKKQGKAWPKFRRKYGTTYGKGISRVARKALWHRGGQFGWTAAHAANVVKGLKAFPPQVGRVFVEKINKKENRKAIRSALAATTVLDLVRSKHKVNGVKILPIVIEDKAESLKKSKLVIEL